MFRIPHHALPIWCVSGSHILVCFCLPCPTYSLVSVVIIDTADFVLLKDVLQAQKWLGIAREKYHNSQHTGEFFTSTPTPDCMQFRNPSTKTKVQSGAKAKWLNKCDWIQKMHWTEYWGWRVSPRSTFSFYRLRKWNSWLYFCWLYFFLLLLAHLLFVFCSPLCFSLWIPSKKLQFCIFMQFVLVLGSGHNF